MAEQVVELLRRPGASVAGADSDSARDFVGLKLADLDGSAVLTATGAWVS